VNGREFKPEFVTATLDHFRGKEVRLSLGFSPPYEPGSLGAWLHDNHARGGTGTFMLASIFVHLGYATHRRGYIRFSERYPDETGSADVPANRGAAEALDEREQRRQAIRELREYAKRLSLGDLNIRDLIEEGRK
jgi:hypothetical protein